MTGESYQQALAGVTRSSMRQGAIPTATPNQALVEASILDVIGYGAFETWVPGDPPKGFSVISPRESELRLKLDPSFLPDLLGRILPTRSCDGELNGVVGLRPFMARHRQLHLRHLSGGRVILHNITRQDYATALHLAEAEYWDGAERMWEGRPNELSPAEQAQPSEFPRIHGPGGVGERVAPLLSALLRRLHVFASPTVTFLDLWVNPGTPATIEVEWSHGPKHREVLQTLTDPFVGIPTAVDVVANPDGYCLCACCADTRYRVPIAATDGSAEIWLRRSTLGTTSSPPRDARIQRTQARRRRLVRKLNAPRLT